MTFEVGFDQLYDADRNAVMIAEVESPNTDEPLEAWYFHPRGSLMIGHKTANSFAPVGAVGDSLLTSATESLCDSDRHVELSLLGEAMRIAAELDDGVLSLKQAITLSLRYCGFDNGETAKIMNIDPSTASTHYSRGQETFEQAQELVETVERTDLEPGASTP